MAKCTLDLSHPYFKKAIRAFDADPGFNEGLEELKKKVEAEHTSCHHVVQPMKGYPDCYDKIWKYDWAPPGDRSSGRKSWRIVVVVPEPKRRPYQLIAATVYAKNQTSQLSLKELAKILATVTTPAVEDTAQIERELFKRWNQDDGATRSLCMGCGETVAVSFDIVVIEDGEQKHSCEEDQLELWKEKP